MSDPTSRTTMGVDLTDRIIAACKPIVDEQPTELVIDAVASAFFGLLLAACPGSERIVLRRYADRLTEMIDAR